MRVENSSRGALSKSTNIFCVCLGVSREREIESEYLYVSILCDCKTVMEIKSSAHYIVNKHEINILITSISHFTEKAQHFRTHL